MKKHITDKNTGISYTRQGNYYLPDLTLPEEEQRKIGVWGQQHHRYIKEHRKCFYTQLIMTGKLYSYLADIDKQAEDTFFRTVDEMAALEGVTEQLKEEDQMEWVRRMNSIRNRASEIVNSELITA